ncbi:head decoration protein [Aeromicrobium sp. 9AM]|uniref:head decoration protein n=1 Tax=Aeromicrobium sp. 9AM TaxID=2653126 RepID=UPI0012F45D96|nr:head decoration protein [Aeromicrobium sp. 9AM]VXC09191.1 conserved hypothetical protein [Aeromicrobium sp. 9AM]
MAAKFAKGVDLNNQRAINLADGTAATDGVTLQQLQAMVRGLSWKDEVRAASTANGTLASAFANGSTLDGVTLATNDRILLKDQSAGAENGIYTVNASGAPTRAVDADSTAELENATVFVSTGTVNADKAFTQTATVTTPGTTAQTWVQFGGGTTVTAGNGLTGTSTISVLLDTASGLVVSGTGLKVDTAVMTRKYAADCAATTNPQTFTHSLGTNDVEVYVWEGNTKVYPDITKGSGTVIVDWGSAPTASQYRVVIQG